MTMRSTVKNLIIAIFVVSVSACASTGERQGFEARDKYEPTSRFFHENNLRLDRNILGPASEFYGEVTPALIQHMIGNGLGHLDLTNDFANYLLQGDIDRSLETFGRLTINTLVGAGGVLDPATEFGLPKQGTDFGITLGKYGVGEGSYLVLPLIGPTTTRDAFGFLVDRAFSPTTYFGSLDVPAGVGPSIAGLGFVDARHRNADLIEDVLYGSADSYVTLRSGYLQRRDAKIAGDSAAVVPDIFDDESSNQ